MALIMWYLFRAMRS